MNILYFAPILFEPTIHGNRCTVKQYITRLKNLGHKIHFVSTSSFNLTPKDYVEMDNLVDSIDIVACEAEKRVSRNQEGYWKFDTAYDEGLGESINYFCEKYSIDTVICTYAFYSKILEYVPDSVLKIVDTHDKMTDRNLLMLQNDVPDEFYSCTQEDEAKYLNRADIIFARRDEEKEFFNKITNSQKCVTIPHFMEQVYLNKNYTKLNKIGIIASDNNVNFKMLFDFLTKILERMTENPIDIEIVVAGNIKKYFDKVKDVKFREFANFYYKLINRQDKIKANDFKKELLSIKKSKYVNFRGIIPDIKDIYSECDLMIVPITFGTGINVKMVEALAYGVPMISTECGIKGVDSSSDFHHCEDLDVLIDKIYETYQNPSILNQLAGTSKECYAAFLEKCNNEFNQCFSPQREKVYTR